MSAKEKREPKKAAISELVEEFMNRYPLGFEDPAYIGDLDTGERAYKHYAHTLYLRTLGRGKGEALLQSGQIDEVRRRLLAVESRQNMVYKYEKAAFRDGMKNDAAAERFVVAFFELLSEKSPDGAALDRYLDAVKNLPVAEGRHRAATWPIATILPYLANPTHHMFLKPEVTQKCAASMGFDLEYDSTINSGTYLRLLEMSSALLDLLVEYGARDYIDVQSFIYLIDNFSVDIPRTVLRVVESESQIRGNVSRFNRDARKSEDRAKSILQQTQYWVFDADSSRFGPSKFVGFRSMTFRDYEISLRDKSDGVAFDGAVSRSAIEKCLRSDFKRNKALTTALEEWGVSLLGPSTLEGVDRKKWRFIPLSQERRYWAFLANPAQYDIEAALQNLEEDTWTVKKSDVQAGDHVIIWQGLKSGKRGIVGLGEVLTDPEVMAEPSASKPFILDPSLTAPEPRVWLRYVKPKKVPLWLGEDDGTLETLSVARARGGTVFHVTTNQWRKILDLVEGRIESGLEDDALAELANRANPKRGGQGFKVPPEVRRAIESHAMRRAEEHFRAKGFEVQDVSSHESFDLLCLKEGKEIRVEVKGTKTAGESVLLTFNEVEHARMNKKRIALFVVHSIDVSPGSEGPIADGGEELVLNPWDVETGSLKPVGFTYTLPRDL